MDWLKTLQFKDYVFGIYLIISLAVILTLKDCFQGNSGKTVSIEVPNKPVFSNKQDRNWNECIFNSLEAVKPEAIASCDSKYSEVK